MHGSVDASGARGRLAVAPARLGSRQRQRHGARNARDQRRVRSARLRGSGVRCVVLIDADGSWIRCESLRNTFAAATS